MMSSTEAGLALFAPGVDVVSLLIVLLLAESYR